MYGCVCIEKNKNEPCSHAWGMCILYPILMSFLLMCVCAILQRCLKKGANATSATSMLRCNLEKERFTQLHRLTQLASNVRKLRLQLNRMKNNSKCLLLSPNSFHFWVQCDGGNSSSSQLHTNSNINPFLFAILIKQYPNRLVFLASSFSTCFPSYMHKPVKFTTNPSFSIFMWKYRLHCYSFMFFFRFIRL